MRQLSRSGGRPRQRTPTLQLGFVGPRGDAGMLLRAPAVEALVWDLDNEISSARCVWMDEHQGWWIAFSYLDTVIDVVLRFFPALRVRDARGGEQVVSRETDPMPPPPA